MKWISNLNYGVQHLAFELNFQHIWAMHHDLETVMPTFVIESVYVIVESLVNNQCKDEFLELLFLVHSLIFFPPFLNFYFISMPFCVLLGRVDLVGDVESKATSFVS
jgi:hypothetical protein